MASVLDLMHAGAAALQRRDVFQAQARLEQAVALAPERDEAWNILGVARITAGDALRAEAAFRHAEAHAPGNPAYPRSRAESLRRLGRPADAVRVLEDAVRRGALSADLACDLADLRLSLRGPRASEAAYRLALLLTPDHGRAINNMAEARRKPEAGLPAGEVVSAFHRLAVLRGTAVARAGLANALLDAGRPDEAEREARAALRLQPGEAAALDALGGALIHRRRHGEAAAVLRKAMALTPDRAEAWANFGFARLNQHADDTEAAFRRAIRLRPDLAEAHVGLGTARMLDGRLREGAASYEWRLRLPAFQSPRRFDRPVWDGRIRPGATLLVHADRGLGDAFQFIRYAPSLRAAGMRVVFHGPGTLLELFRASGVADQIHDADGPLPVHDLHIDVMSLIHAMGTELDSVPATVPYLVPPEERSRRWAGRLAELPGLKVGLVWAGSVQVYAPQRSPRLRSVLPLIGLPGTTTVGLQVGQGRDDLKGIPVPSLVDWGAEVRDFADTAAIIAGLDVVVSPCTSVTHLAGALGRPLAVLLDQGAEWRWLRARTDSPWYPTATLYRQTEAGDWTGPVERLRRDLLALAERRAREG
ncbi:tetratricopeptide repeat protein [Azospirillum doebereinerae]|uniref:tetratricopeptide repeat protein n=1 Tax=Azospirillum doebereinerae TaxID=92933 RepID=UPI001EE533E0|nr:tetratricopeptide repeat protein [Azospirillum doebereinerae]